MLHPAEVGSTAWGTGKLEGTARAAIGIEDESNSLVALLEKLDARRAEIEAVAQRYAQRSAKTTVAQPSSPPPSQPTVEAPPRVAEETLPALAQRWAVIIGVSEYKHAGSGGLTNLAYADSDARAFRDKLLELGWDKNHINCLLNEEATKEKVEAALAGWLTKAGKDDLVVFYWSGHGYPDPTDPPKVYFACHDADPSRPFSGWRMDKDDTVWRLSPPTGVTNAG